MTPINKTQAQTPLRQLALTLTTERKLKAQGIFTVAELQAVASTGLDQLKLDRQRTTEVRDVLASRGF